MLLVKLVPLKGALTNKICWYLGETSKYKIDMVGEDNVVYPPLTLTHRHQDVPIQNN